MYDDSYYNKLYQHYQWVRNRQRTLLAYRQARFATIKIGAAPVYVIPVLPDDVEGIKDLVQRYDYATIYSSIGLISIGVAAFKDNKTIINIDIPNVQFIGGMAFNNCENLETVSFKGKTDNEIPLLDNINAFILQSGEIIPKLKIIVPDNLYNKWITAPNWAALSDHIFKESQI